MLVKRQRHSISASENGRYFYPLVFALLVGCSGGKEAGSPADGPSIDDIVVTGQKRETPVDAFYWNSWIEKGHDDEAVIVDFVEPDPAQPFRLVTHASEFDFQYLFDEPTVRTGKPDPYLIEWAKANADNSGVVHLVARLTFHSSRLFLAPGESDEKYFELKVVADERDAEPTQQDSGLAGGFNLSQIQAMGLTRGGFEYEFFAESPGCAQYSITIWSSDGRLPLDHMVADIPIGEADDCDLAWDFGANFSTLLWAGAGLDGGRSPVDVGLFVYDLGESLQAILVGPDPEAPLTSDLEDVELLAWRWALRGDDLEEKLLENLESNLRLARAMESVDGYGKVARYLKDLIFLGQTERDKQEARSALAALLSLSHRYQGRMRVGARVVADGNVLLPLPLSLLSAGGEQAVIPTPFTVVAPLPTGIGRAAECVSQWSLAAPSKISRIPVKTAAGLEELYQSLARSPWIENWIDGLTDLKDLFDQSMDQEADHRRSAGLVLLSHHEDGDIWFDDREVRLAANSLDGDFPQGGLAIIAACNVAGHSNGDLIRSLSLSGFSTVVASPFSIPADYGSQFALEFVSAIDDVHGKGERIDLITLLDRVSQSTAEHFPEGGAASQVNHEFIVLGALATEVCSDDDTERSGL